MTAFAHADYRKALRLELETRGISQRQIAVAAGVQPPYLSAVLAGRAQLNADQLYGAGKALELDDATIEYLLLLLEHERSQHADRRRVLKRRIDAVRSTHLRTTSRVDAKPVPTADVSLAEYYLDPWAMILHVALGLPRWNGRLDAVAKALGVSVETLEAPADTLERLGYVARGVGGRYTVQVRHRHLPEDSPLCGPHQTIQRLGAVDRLQRVPRARRYGFAVTFSADEETRRRLQDDFLAFVRRCETTVRTEARPESVYQMNFDLFPWTDVAG